MTSLLTNNGAMVALQTLKSVNSSLSETQGQISTGKKVDNAKQNASVWAISKTMESDVNGFKSVQESLALGESTVAVARQATETVTELLGQVKERIVSAQGDNVDTGKLQKEIESLTGQIESVVGAAQFNGLNLVDGNTTSTDVLSSLDRASDGSVSSSSITVSGANLSTGGYTAKNVFGATTGVTSDGDVAGFGLDKTGGTDDLVIDSSGAAFAAGDTISVTINDQVASYTVSADDIDATYTAANTDALVAAGLKAAIDDLGITGLTASFDGSGTLALATGAGTPADPAADTDLVISAQFENAGSGGLGLLSDIDVENDPATALANIEGMITRAIDATAAFGTVENRISIQKDFVSNLSDSVKSGIGSLVDADMEETSARLQALQVQQQLATQSLSIANQGPQQLLSLFR
ncbi:flagellin [Shimia sp. R10_1]|uniref:flagellin n=1 Tax=Shimia sp. R10_1 TaxID=2821095 RepID=UPI001ADA79C2|nr:flagellin [Shimia sp. R10_1]MBO9473755.1 flagellin [Shimia sp. R10_1]